MKQRGRRNSKVPAAEVVDLVSDSGDDSDAAQAPAPAKTNSRRARRGKGRAAAAAAAAAAIAGSAQASAHDNGDYEFVDSDFELEAEEQTQQKQKQQAMQQQKAGLPLGRKRALPTGRSALAAAGVNGSAAPAGPAAKKARITTAAAGAAKGGSRANNSKVSKVLTGKAAATKGFNALFLCASQHTGGSQGSADAAGSSQQAGPLALTATSAALAVAAAAGGGPAPAAAAAAAGGGPPSAELWVDKCVPTSVADLVVHKKKVAEVQDWLTFYNEHRAKHHTRALLVTGPPGCGKSVTVRVVAASMGFEVMEWTPPVPTLWADHQYMAGAGVRYTSKLDEFDMFVARCKFAALPLTCNATQQQTQAQTQQTQVPSQQQQQQQDIRPPRKQKLILVEDLPHVVDPERRARVASALQELATTARCPVVVIATTEEGSGGKAGGYGSYGAAGAGITTKGLHKDFVTVLDQCGAGSINFNPITGPNLTKALTAIAEAEGYSLEHDMAQGIVAGAGGDLRNAIQNLQLMLQGPGAVKSKAGARKGKASKAPKRPRKGKSDPESVAAAEAAQANVTAQVARDQGLSVYHAIGKLLHYKRNQDAGGSGGTSAAAAAGGGGPTQQQQQQQQGDGMHVEGEASQGASQQQGRLVQAPLRLNPEAIIQGSGLEALQVTAFLSENYPHFMLDDAMEEAAEAAAALSDAGYMCCYRNSAAPSVAFWDESDPNAASLTAAAAVSVAARGLLWANRRPAPSRWLPLKGPSCFMPERAASSNMTRLAGALQALQDQAIGGSSSSVSSGRGELVMGLAGQLMHAGRQDRAAQVLPYLQVLARAPSRLWLHALLPRSWGYIWQGSITERPSQALQGQGTAAVAAALEAAVAAAAAGAGGLGARGSQGGGLGVGGGKAEDEEEESEEIESDSD